MKTLKLVKHYFDFQRRNFKGYYPPSDRKYDLPFPYKRIYFYHIRKTAGVAIKFAFLHHTGYSDLDKAYKDWFRSPDFRLKANNLIYTGWNIPLINKGDYFFAASHEPMHFLKVPKDSFTITCLREPAKRVISQYNQIMGLIKNNIPHPMLKHASKWVGKDFKTFVDRLPPSILSNQLYMFSAKLSVEEALKNINEVNFILHTENLKEGLTDLSTELNLALPLTQQNSSKHKEVISESDELYLKNKLDKEYSFYNQVLAMQCVEF